MTGALVLTLIMASPASEGGIHWEKSFEKAREKAQAQDKPIMVDFWAEWCGWCHRLDRTTYVDPLVVAKAENFVTVKVNTEGSSDEQDVTKRYNVPSLPTILFLSPGGLQVWRVSSFMGPGRFPFVMDKALEAARRVGAWEAELARNPDDPAALAAIGAHLFQQECYEEGEGYLVRATEHDGERPAAERRQSRFLLAMLWSHRQRYAEAETLIKEALNLDPGGEDQPKLLFVLGHTYVSWGRQELGMETMQVIVRDYPRSPIARKARETLVTLEQK